MGLRLKFNLILLAVFIAGFATVGVVAHRYLDKQARDDAARAAGIALDAASFSAIDPRVASALGSRVAELKMTEFAVADAHPGMELDAITKLQISKTGEVTGEVGENDFRGQSKAVSEVLLRVRPIADGVKAGMAQCLQHQFGVGRIVFEN